ncbi:M28 family peptidase, partial [bacterium]|nr:M28 family peptidase [bacterium]
MKKFGIILLVLWGLNSFLWANPGADLIRIERKSADDLGILIDNAIPLLMELENCFLSKATQTEREILKKIDYHWTIIESNPDQDGYYVLGMRPDTDMTLLESLGIILHKEDNWVILKAYSGVFPEDLGYVKVFVTPLKNRSLKRPVEQVRLVKKSGTKDVQPLVQKIVDSVDTDHIASLWTDLTTNSPTGTRYSSSQGCYDAGDYCYTFFDNLGLTASYQTWSGSYAPNVIGEQTGALTPDQVFIVEGHLDDLPSSGLAPGADDNASGAIHALEAAQIMSCYAFKNTIKYLLITGEEQGLLGSEAYADEAELNNENILGVINMDMPGWEGNSPGSENLDLNYNAASEDLGLLYAQCAVDYSTGLNVDAFLCPGLTASDHYPFWQKGWKAICGITDNEGYCGHTGNYPYYHTSNDTIANCGDPSFFYATVKTTIATLAELGEPFQITFDQDAYACSSLMTIYVGDRALNTSSSTVQTVNITIWSTTETTPETVTLTEQGVDSMIFMGTILTSLTAPVNGDGLLSISGTDTITAQYYDAIDCDGTMNVAHQAVATADCVAPIISNVQITNITTNSAVVTWQTNEPADSTVYYGTTPPTWSSESTTDLVTDHSVLIYGLDDCTLYYVWVESADGAGNSDSDDNGGSYYTFTTQMAMNMFYDDMESGSSNWTAASPWAISTEAYHSSSHAWSDSPGGNYGNYADISLTSDAFDLSSTTQALLTFWHIYALEATYDFGYVEISTNGSSWTQLDSFTGTQAVWTEAIYDLSAYIGYPSVQIRFRLDSDSYQTMDGWHIDDVTIGYATPCVPLAVYDSHIFVDDCPAGGAGDGDGILDAGETIVFQIDVANTGSGDLTGVWAELSTSTTGVTVTDAQADYNDILEGTSGTSLSPHFTVYLAESIACGTTLNFSLTIHANEGDFSGGSFSETVGEIVPGDFTLVDEDFESSWGTYGDNPPTGWTIEDYGDEGTPTWNANDWYRYSKGGAYSYIARVYYSP